MGDKYEGIHHTQSVINQVILRFYHLKVEREGSNEKFEKPIKDFLGQFLSEKELHGTHVREVDISAPIMKDMESIRKGDYQVRNVLVAPSQENSSGVSIHFYVGQTEFHIGGAAADLIADQAR